jgi:hypothetical protein
MRERPEGLGIVTLAFLHKLKTSHVTLRLVCPRLGVPLPSIQFDLEQTLGLQGKLEMSLRLSEALIQHIIASTHSAEVAN